MSDYQLLLSKAKTTLEIHSRELKNSKKELRHINEEIENHEQARVIFQKSAKMTQKHLATHLSGIVSKALKSVFPDPYTFIVRFVERRNTTECDLLLEKNGKEFNPLKSCGFGVADVVSITLRIAFLLLSGRNKVLIMDEPGRHVSTDRMPYLSNVLKQLGKDLGIQFIIVTHSKEMSEFADNIYRIRKENKMCLIENKS